MKRQLKYETLEERVVLSTNSTIADTVVAAPTAVSQADAELPRLAAALQIDQWVHSLVYHQFNQLLPEHVPFLTTQQVASIPDIYWFSLIRPESRAMFSVAQVQSLKVSTVHLDYFTPQQVSWLTVPQIQSLWVADFKYLSASQTPHLTTAQIAAIPDPGPFADWTPAARAALTAPQIQALNVGKVWINNLTPQQVSYLTPAQIQSLRVVDFALLSAAQTPYLTPAQIAAIPDPGPFADWTAAARAALTLPQIQALKVNTVHLDNLTPQQVAWLTVPQIQSLWVPDFKYLSGAQTPHLTTAQIAAIPDPGPFAEWSPVARAALTAPQIQALNVGKVWINRLTPQQVSYLTPAQIQSLRLADFAPLSAAQTPHLTPAQIATIPDPSPFAEWTAAARAALTLPQIQALKVSAVHLDNLTPQQVAWLTVPQIQSLSVADFMYLSGAQTPHLTTAQIAAIPDPGPFAEWSAVARAALTLPQIQALNVGKVWINRLTPQQVSYLTPAQIQSLRLADFAALSAAQTPHLTPAQIATIPDPSPFAEWTAAARAALTLPQIQALKVSAVHLDNLTPQQVAWLTVPQIQSLSVADFMYLNGAQTPHLTTAQIAAISDPGPFAEWSAVARAALTLPQIQALNVVNVWINRLTPQQVSYLTPAQIQSLRMHDFKYLWPGQVPSLTLAQVASIPDPGPFAEWTPTARAALTMAQIRVLDVARVWINGLTPVQVSWLTPAQVAALRWEEFSRLSPEQIQFLTPAQFAAFPSGFILRTLPDELQRKFTTAQLLALSPQNWAQFTSSPVVPPTNYTPAVDVPVVDGMPASHAAHLEMERVLNLVPLAAATHMSVATGNWADPNVWHNRQVPTPGAKVVISAGTTVRFDVGMPTSSAINTLRIDGTLTFSTTASTRLAVDTLVVTASGKLHIGTAAAPILPHVSAQIVITDGGPLNTTWDPYLLSRGVISMGEVRMYGKAVTPFVSLAVPPVRGATQLTLTQAPTNWRVGDKIVLTGTHQHVQNNQSEELIIRAINGTTVTVDPLQYDHLPPAGFGLSVYVANFTRNIQLTAADSSVVAERPHLMFMHNPNVDVENISVTGFGRTNKDVPINDAVVVNGVLQPGTGLNQRARYAMHFHHTGVNPIYAPAVVRGSVVDGSPGWGYVNHSSNVIMEDNISYETLGSGFVTEDGNEIGVMRRNLALGSQGSGDEIQSRTALHDFGHKGHGFWLQGPGVALIDNVAGGHGDAAFMYFTSSNKNLFDAVNLDNPALAAGRKAVPVGAVPLKEFSGNVAFTSRSGLEIWFHQTRSADGESLINGFKAWNLRAVGIDMPYTGRVTIRNALLLGDMLVFRGFGISANHESGDITIENANVQGFEQGVTSPQRRTNVIVDGIYNNVQNIYITGAADTIRSLNIAGKQSFLTATPVQLGFHSQYAVYASNHVDFRHRSLEAILAPDRISFTRGRFTLAVLSFAEQLPGYIPFPEETSAGYVPAEYLNLTNQELRDRYGVSLGGGYPPSDAVAPAGFQAFLDYTPGR